MGSLSNLYISQSYTSLIHLGNDGPITNVLVGQYVPLQDGLGNNLGISINPEGDVQVSGIVSASNIPIDIATQAELNAYTQSTNIRLNNLESTTASLNSSVTQLNASSASQQISINALNQFTASNQFSASIVQLNQFTSSANIRLTNLESTSASVNISISNLNASSASQQIQINGLSAKTGSYATTGSNTFNGINNFSQSVVILGGLDLYGNGITIGLPKNMGDPYQNIGLNTAFVGAQNGSSNELLLTGDQMTNKGVRITNGLSVTGSLRVTQTFTASLQEGYVWVGDANGISSLVSTASFIDTFVSGNLVTTSSFNAYTQSNDQRVLSLENNSASVNISISNINATTQSLQGQLATIGSQSGSWITESETGSFARYDVSNPWSAPQTFTTITASAARIANINYPTTDGTAGQFVITNGAGTLSFDDVHTILESVRYGENITIGDPLYVSGSNGNNPVVYRADASNPNKMPVIYIASSTNVANTNTTAITLGLITGVTTTGYPAGTEIYVAEGGGWSANRPSGSNSIVQPLGIVTKEGPGGSGRGLVLNPGPATLPNIQNGYVWVGNGTNQPISVATSSFAILINTGSLVTTSSFNQFTQSINAFTQSTQISINALNQFTSSVTASVDTGSLLLNAQANGVNTIQFTRGDSSTFNVVMTVSSSAAAPQNTYTAIYSGSTWNVTHNLNTSTPLVFAYESGSQYTLPAALDVINPNQITLTWSRIVNGSLIVVNGGGGTETYYGDVNNQTTASFIHNLDTLYPLVQFYESGSNAQAIPAQIISTNVNTTTLYFSNPVNGKVVIKK